VIELWKDGITLDDKAKKAKEFKGALEKWGHYKPK
jgi:ribulose-bisphosphate carboxylase large chain